MQSMGTAATGLEAQQKKLAITANNIANVNTTGFKKSRANMASLLYLHQRQPGVEVGDARMPSGLSVGVGVKVMSTQELHTQGSLKQTNAPYDLAINGGGFFQVILPSGETAYTRAGDFQVDGEGNMVNSSGFLVEPQITVPANALSVEISEQGIVSARLPGEAASQEIGALELAKFVNPSGLENKGSNVYLETSASGSPVTSEPGIDGTGLVLQGHLETSNVNVAEEMIDMIEGQRAFEMASKIVSTSGDMERQITDMVR
jgi:flagellar basal-body rod protein FlgG